MAELRIKPPPPTTWSPWVEYREGMIAYMGMSGPFLAEGLACPWPAPWPWKDGQYHLHDCHLNYWCLERKDDVS